MTPTSYLVISFITQEAECVVSMTFSLAAFYLSFSCILTLLLKTVKYTHLFSLFCHFSVHEHNICSTNSLAANVMFPGHCHTHFHHILVSLR
jgi:hypothetical protein